MTRQWQSGEVDEARFPMPFRVYKTPAKAGPRPLVLYFAGAAFGAAPSRTGDAPAALAMAEAGALVVEADCSDPKQAVFPGCLERAFEALKHLFSKRKLFATNRSPVLVAGDEAGGNLAASLALKARDAMPGELAGQVLLSPLLDPRMVTVSFREADEIDLQQRWAKGWQHYLANPGDGQHPYAAPCLCSRLMGVAPALIMTSLDDPLRDESLDYAERLRTAGVSVNTKILPEHLGWTGLYDGRVGEWHSHVSTEFSRFLSELPH
ncbi:alpha/beta hydrolase (plasmid) [Rhizobium rosettiformans]|uniref:Alpha/beta hydrolase n=2 Tax=Rhizobium/Agrobacterium group TaxID=227290 RepID=A0ABX7F2W1_9HYPH|nr:alpha/beta hydrolase [Rhizobium rosettiformans]